MHSDGSDQTRLTDDADIEREPRLSPDGTQILFVRVNGLTGGFPDVPNEVLWVMNTDGTDQHEVFAAALPNKPAGTGAPPIVSNDRDPSWSPDGTQIAFYREGIGITMSGIMVMNADATDARVVRPISGESSRVSELAWSPDGTRLAYAYDYVCCGVHVMFVNVDGSPAAVAELIGPRDAVDTQTSDTDPAWSPDGHQIAFSGQPNVNGTLGAAGLWTADANGSPNPVQLTADDGRFPAWAPTGDRIAFERAGHIWTAHADGTGQLDLGAGSQPSWAASEA